MFRSVFASIFASVSMLSFSYIVIAQGPPVSYSFIFPSGDGGSWIPNCNDFGGTCNLPDRWHTGEDVPASEGTPVYAPAAGIVRHAAARGGLRGGYGYVVIIEHNFNNLEYVCSVLGHMRGHDLQISVGQVVNQGDILGFLGSQEENGGWIPHFHFGINKGRYKGDFEPGCSTNPGEWWYSGYTKCQSYLANWYDPSDFIRGYNYNKFIIGYFPDGWHTDGVSQAFLDSYNLYSDPDGHNKLGLPHHSQPYVFEWGETKSLVQIFEQPDTSKPRFTDGFAWMMYNSDHRRCHVITMTFYGIYVNGAGDLLYGVPLNNEYVDTAIGNLIGQSGRIYIRQDFSLNKTMLWDGVATQVIDTPLGTVKVSSIGGSEPLTIKGWPLSKTQAYIHCTGGLSLESNDWYRIMQDGVEVNQTTLSEATFVNLIPGTTYRYRVELVNGVYGVLDVSNEIDITMPSADGFYIVPELDGDNSVFLRVVKDRFPSAIALGIYRNNVEIARITGTAFSDNSLEYNTLYVYRASALTASNIILGWSDVASITTKSPQSPPPPTIVPFPADPQIPFVLTEGIGALEPGPFVTGGYATAYYTVQMNGTASVSIDRFEVDGNFIDQWGNSYARYWPAVEFVGGRVFNPGETFRYQMKNTDHFPDLPTTAHLKAYLKLHDFAGLKGITQALPSATAELVFAVQNIPAQPIVPNLTASIACENTNPTTDDNVTLQISVENNGQALCPPSALALTVDGVEEKVFSIPELVSYARHSFSANIGALAFGSHVITALADKNNEVFESNENDNTASIALDVSLALRANVIVQTTNIAQTVFVGDTMQIAFEIWNRGNIASGACQLLCGASSQNPLNQGAITLDPDKIIIPALSPNESFLAVAVFSAQLPDTYTVWASVDLGNEILESNESDNSSSITIEVASVWPKKVVLSPVSDTNISRDWNNASGSHENPYSQTLDVYTRKGINRYSRALIRFDFSAIPDFAAIESAELKLYQLSQSEYKDNQLYLNMLTQSFDSSYVTWTKRANLLNWASAGGTYSSSYQTNLLIPSMYLSTWHTQTGAVNMWRTWNATAFVQAVVNGAITYRGCILRQDDIANSSENQGVSFASQDYLDTSLRPQLIIKYHLGPEVVFKDNFELGIDARWKVNRTAIGSVPVARLDTTPISVGMPLNSGDQILYMGDSTSGTYARATMELDLDLSKYTEATLEFDWATYSLYGYECIRLDIYDGVWHHDVALYNVQAWQHTSIDLVPYNRTKPLTIRFRSWMDYPESSDAAYIDNVVVKGR